MDNFEAWSAEGKYGVRISAKILEKMEVISRSAQREETGGILVGYYNRKHDCAIVTDCSDKPEDSRTGKNYFLRGVKGLQEWLEKLWRLGTRKYYLGEWHYHPFGSCEPSGVDVKQLKENAEDEKGKCPEPVMVIVGGDPTGSLECEGFVYVRGKGLVRVVRQWERVEIDVQIRRDKLRGES